MYQGTYLVKLQKIKLPMIDTNIYTQSEDKAKSKSRKQ